VRHKISCSPAGSGGVRQGADRLGFAADSPVRPAKTTRYNGSYTDSSVRPSLAAISG